MAGFTFLARIDHASVGNGHNVVCAVPGFDEGVIPERYRTAPPHCDHCKVQRHRNDTFILRHDARGEFRQIGRNCLADYIGHDPEGILALFAGYGRILADCRDESGDWSSDRCAFTAGAEAVDVLAYTVAAIERFGWCSKKQAESDYSKTATAIIVNDNLLNPMHAAKREYDVHPTESHYEEAAKALAWVREVLTNKARKSEFEYNLTAILSADFVATRVFGFACAAMFCYRRAVENDLTRKAEAATRAPSQHVGTIGARIDLAGVHVLGCYPYDGNFGPCTIVRMRDAAGNALVWFASGVPAIAAGDLLTVRGTVKRHATNNRDGSPETVLTRVAVNQKRQQATAAA
jgi:hypothetical protein